MAFKTLILFLFSICCFLDCAHAIGQQRVESDPVQMRNALVGNDIGQALSASWLRTKVAVSNMLLNETPRARRNTPTNSSQRFLGFVEGLLQVSIPAAFSENVVKSEGLWNGLIRFPIQDINPWSDDENIDIGMAVDIPAFSIIINDKKISASVGTGGFPTCGLDGHIDLPEQLAQRILAGCEGDYVPVSSVLFTKEFVFIAVVSDGIPGASVTCISRSDRKIVWDRKSIAYATENYSGNGNWFTELRINNNMIYLFHVCETSIGVEGWNTDGNKEFVFATNEKE